MVKIYIDNPILRDMSAGGESPPVGEALLYLIKMTAFPQALAVSQHDYNGQ
jgi:hypothetical protein